MIKKSVMLLTLALALVLSATFQLTAQAAPSYQLPQFATPTPGADGRIIYIVQPGDTCLRIQLISGVPVEQIRTLNRLDENCTLSVDQPILLGLGGPSGATPTVDVSLPTPIPPDPTATPFAGLASVCVVAYDDINGDSLRQETEVIIPNAVISITGTSGQFSNTLNSIAGLDPSCFENVPEGTYNLSVGVPENYFATTALDYQLEVLAGGEYFVDFGAQSNETTAIQTDNDSSVNLLGIVGLVLVLAGIGLGVYYWQSYGGRRLKF